MRADASKLPASTGGQLTRWSCPWESKILEWLRVHTQEPPLPRDWILASGLDLLGGQVGLHGTGLSVGLLGSGRVLTAWGLGLSSGRGANSTGWSLPGPSLGPLHEGSLLQPQGRRW